VLQIGANRGQEAAAYWEAGVRRGTFIEAHPQTFERLQKTVSDYPGFRAVNALLSDVSGQQTRFYVASNGAQSSSMLKPSRHVNEHPNVTFTDAIMLATTRLDELKLGEFDLVAIDVQGAEMQVIRGGLATIARSAALWIEVSQGGLYTGDSKVEEVVSMLGLLNFGLVDLHMNRHGWGDAFFLKRRSAQSLVEDDRT
jgi:FkbM family methyltransferase